ncbi:hypothetical protein K1T71_004784 [Dendrolimus kikuchii]|uniref:Uncharacterized protein n=1 Tax=Dendrolimus kikuchii TaxID=765133 RepID=A0ACC1D9D3_9NEOP|nr:hypothetical protein K1T71_004784 [Dendrolimus kikuchii]
MSRVISRRGLSRGAVSRPFGAYEVLAALPAAATAAADARVVCADLDAEGMVATAGGGGEGGAARLAACARLAPHVAARTGTLEWAPLGASGGVGALRLRLDCDLPPHHEIALWFHEDLLALVGMPFLALRNIRGRDDYACHECGARFESPNPLKVHLFLSCAPYEPAAFWREFAARASPPPASVPAEPDLARLEALATEWGRAQGGHLCVYCGKMYSRKYGLKIHIRTHTGYRPLRCRYCLRAFGDPSNLNKHVRLHAGARGSAGSVGGVATPRACSACGKVVARRRDLERHARTHAPPGR